MSSSWWWIVFFSQNKGYWNDGNFVFPIISTPNKLKKYFSCSYNLLLLEPQVWTIGKFGILKKTICHQLGEFLFLANVCSHSFLNLPSLWMDQNFKLCYKNKVTICFPLILFPSPYPFLQVRMPPKSKRRKQVAIQWSQLKGDDVDLSCSKTNVRRLGWMVKSISFFIHIHIAPHHDLGLWRGSHTL